MKLIFYKTIKIVLGTMFAIEISKYLGLNYYTSSGIVVILSIQNTRKESFKLAIIRISASIVALHFKLQDGIVVNSVLVMHLLLQESASLGNLLNEYGLMLVGVTIALLFNLYMPSNEKVLKWYQQEIEKVMREIFIHMSKALREQVVSIKEETLYNELDNLLTKTKEEAYQNLNNYFFIKEDYFVSYIQMRHQQFIQMKRMWEHFNRLSMIYSVTLFVSDFIDKLPYSINKKNKTEDLLHALYQLRMDFSQVPLPKTRIEFENRAMLYQFLNDLEQFLQIKKEFHQKYD